MDNGPKFTPPQEIVKARSNDFNYAVESLQSMSPSDLGMMDIRGRLEEINEKVSGSNEEEKERARIALKKILIVLPPWRRGANLIHQNLEHVAYSPEEQEHLARLREEALERQDEIDKEIEKGISPWLAGVTHNEKNAQNPVAVGFYQMPDGQIRTIFGSRYFQSKRQLNNDGTIFGGRSENKEVNLLSTEFRAINRPEIIKSSLFDLLPEDLRKRFENGEILVTGGTDLYDLSNQEIEELAASKKIDAMSQHIDQKIAQTKGEKQYHLLYQSDYHSEQTGRTGVLMVTEHGMAQPVLITVGEKQFVLEIKGCGKKGGGFGEKHHRTGRDIITGGAEREQAINEFNRLSEMTDEDAPKAVASILFDNAGYEQGYVLRLAPSTVRASHTSNEVYPEIDSPKEVARIVDIYALELAAQVFAPNPKILDRSSHSENILLWGDGRHTFTDFSDHVTFSDVQYPHEENYGGYMTPKQMLTYYIEMVEEIPGYQEDRDKPLLIASLEKAFAQKSQRLLLTQTDTYEDIIQKLRENGIAYQVFSARRKEKYRPEGVFKEVEIAVTKESTQTSLSLASEQEFLDTYRTNFQEMLISFDALYKNRVPSPELSNIRDLIEVRDLNGMLAHLDQIYKLWSDDDNLDKEERYNMYKPISYFANLDSRLIQHLKTYLAHEREVIFGSESSVPFDKTGRVKEAKEEIEQKIQELETILKKPSDVYKKFTDIDWIKSFITLNCYQQ